MMAKKAQPKAGVGGTISREDLVGLMMLTRQQNSVAADARGQIGRRVKQLEEKGFNHKVFKALDTLVKGKNAAGVTAVLKCVDQYIDIMGWRDQGDLEDWLAKTPDTRTAFEKSMDGELDPDAVKAAKGKGRGKKDKPTADAMDSVAGNHEAAAPEAPTTGYTAAEEEARSSALEMLKRSLAEAEDPDAVNIAVERFTDDNSDKFPGIDDDALTIAHDRLAEIATHH